MDDQLLALFLQGKEQTVSVLRRLLQELGAELQEDRSEFKRTSEAAQGRAAEVRLAGVGPPAVCEAAGWGDTSPVVTTTLPAEY